MSQPTCRPTRHRIGPLLVCGLLVALALIARPVPATADVAADYAKASAELQRLEKELTGLATAYEKTLAEHGKAVAETNDLQARVARLDEWRGEAREELRQLAISTYKYGSMPVDGLAAASGSESIEEFTRGVRYLRSAQERREKVLTTFSRNEVALSSAKRRLDERRAAEQSLLKSLVASRESIEAAVESQEEIVNSLAAKLTAEQVAQLERLRAPSGGGALGPSGVRYGRLVPPPELALYGNGRLPESVLALIGIGRHRLWGPAADAFKRMWAAAYADGIMIGITDSYRSYEGQVDVARRKGLYKNGGLAATPGTSNHGWGLATDLDLSYAALQWMRANAKLYGFVEDVPRESWHWTFRAF